MKKEQPSLSRRCVQFWIYNEDHWRCLFLLTFSHGYRIEKSLQFFQKQGLDLMQGTGYMQNHLKDRRSRNKGILLNVQIQVLEKLLMIPPFLPPPLPADYDWAIECMTQHLQMLMSVGSCCPPLQMQVCGLWLPSAFQTSCSASHYWTQFPFRVQAPRDSERQCLSFP